MTDPRTEDIKGHCPECEAGLAALRAAFDAANDRPEPIAQWEDPRVQAVYEVIAFCDTPPPEHHWEGWTARRIVDRLAALEQPDRAQAMRDAGYTRRPTLREMADPEQREQEPVAYLLGTKSRPDWPYHSRILVFTDQTTVEGIPASQAHIARQDSQIHEAVPLYTHPPRREWRGLTEEEIAEIWYGAVMAQSVKTTGLGAIGFARAIEAALKERNA